MTMVIFGRVILGNGMDGTGGCVGGVGLISGFVLISGVVSQQSSRLLQQSCSGQQVLQHALELEVTHVLQLNDEHSHLSRQQD